MQLPLEPLQALYYCFHTCSRNILFTLPLTFQLCLLGSQTVARSIMQAASIHLTPVTLELGGKCPCIIYGKIDITAAARRIAWAKFFNAGQSCVAPDYVLCSPANRDALLPELRKVLENFYGKDPQTCPDFSRIVSPRHWTRLMELLGKSSGKVVLGGESSQEDKYIGGLQKQSVLIIELDSSVRKRTDYRSNMRFPYKIFSTQEIQRNAP